MPLTKTAISAILLVTIGLMVLFQVCKPFDWKRRVLMIAMTGASVVSIVWFGSSFGISPLDLKSGMVLAVFMGLAYPVMHVILKAFELGAILWDKLRQMRRREEEPEEC